MRRSTARSLSSSCLTVCGCVYSFFHASINPTFAPATSVLERLEKLTRGEDPDAQAGAEVWSFGPLLLPPPLASGCGCLSTHTTLFVMGARVDGGLPYCGHTGQRRR